MSAAEDFEHGLRLVEEGYRNGLREFVKWAQQSWELPPKDKKWPFADDEPPSDEYRKGHDDCLQSLTAALDLFLDEIEY